MYYIKKCAKILPITDISIVDEWADENYWSLYDRNDLVIKEKCYTKEEAEYLWNKNKYYVTDFISRHVDNKAFIIVKMYALYDDYKIIKQSKGMLLYQDIEMWFPELVED